MERKGKGKERKGKGKAQGKGKGKERERKGKGASLPEWLKASDSAPPGQELDSQRLLERA